MRHLILGLVAAVAVMAAAPAMACGYSPCGQPLVYAAPVPVYTSSGCNPCGGIGWGYSGYGHARLADPEQQYYYVNQGPTYSGPGAWAPSRVYGRPYHYGYSGGRYGYAGSRYYGGAGYGYGHRAYGYGHRAMRRYY